MELGVHSVLGGAVFVPGKGTKKALVSRGFPEPGRLRGASGRSGKGRAGGGGLGRGNSGRPSRLGPGAAPDHCVQPAWQAFSAGRGGLEVPLPQSSHLVGWPHHSWEEQLWSALKLEPRDWLLRGWGRVLP